MQENNTPAVTSNIPNPIETPPPSVKSPKPTLLYLLSFTTILASFVAGFFIWQNQKLVNEFKKSLPTQTPTVASTPTSSPDPTTDWKVYENKMGNVSFKYPLDWNMDNTKDDGGYNSLIILTKEKASIQMIFNVDGIGGLGQTYQGIPVLLDGKKLFKYQTTHNDKSKIVNKIEGVTDSLTESLGFFKFGDTTYYLTLTYPAAYDSFEEKKITTEFDLMLSTLKFNQKESPSPLPAKTP